MPFAKKTTAAPATSASLTTKRGHCRPFGATIGPDGVNFAVFSRHAEQVNLVLFKDGIEGPWGELALDPTVNKTGDVWHIMVCGIDASIQYAYRVFGPYAPEEGHRFDSDITLIDPYALSITGGHQWGHADSPYGQVAGRPARRCRIIDNDFDWEHDVPPATPMGKTVIYELHVRGYTCSPTSRAKQPGTFLGLCEKIPYLKSLGVTAVQLMPALEFDELEQSRANPITKEPLKNYWGYAPISFFAPKDSYAVEPGQQVQEFKQMVKTFHREGLEVILDVVYNHTCEGNENGPTVGYRGLDNAIYYMLDQKGKYYNFAGCGNTFNCNHPLVRDLIIDSLTYLVAELHVDGFRFDLASILGRGRDGRVLQDPPLIRHIAEHPVLAGTKLIAEAWDAAGLHQLGQFPAWGRWAELNGFFRDDVRNFVRGKDYAVAALAKRICGSLDIYGDSSRHPYHSINFITSHDGFTLNDLVSYNEKHNWANGEDDQDGADHNLSWNCGHEGPTDDEEIMGLRTRQMRNLWTILMISQGVPFISHGDEFARTQDGNNNTYCQDNETAWVNWKMAEQNADLLRFTRILIALRKKYFALNREEFVNRVSWHGTEIGAPDWTGKSRALAFQLHGWHSMPDLFVMFNAHWEWREFRLPPHNGEWKWQRLVDTSLPSPQDITEECDAVAVSPPQHYNVSPRSTAILMSPP